MRICLPAPLYVSKRYTPYGANSDEMVAITFDATPAYKNMEHITSDWNAQNYYILRWELPVECLCMC